MNRQKKMLYLIDLSMEILIDQDYIRNKYYITFINLILLELIKKKKINIYVNTKLNNVTSVC